MNLLLRSEIFDREAVMSGIVEDVSDDNYEGFTEASAAIVAYGIATCEPCKAYDPVLAEIAQQFTNVRFGKAKMHVPGRCRAIKKRHQFETYPTTHFFSNGMLVLTKEGKLEPAELASLIRQSFSIQT
ncbi:MAG TPA: thioredoxin family protein [Nitrospirales bacterium]|nr:thioredoxin family protein [Nitrospira sp. MA-1]HNP60865.1 thioredoxin family protein [Nitrospirales bacterium]